MADFERNLASLQACEGPNGGSHAIMYQSVNGAYIRPYELPLGNVPLTLDDPEALFARMQAARGAQIISRLSAIDIVRICQSARHADGAKTLHYSSRAEHVASIALANEADVQPINPKILWRPGQQQPGVYRISTLYGDVRQGTLVQDFMTTNKERSASPIRRIVRAAISQPHREAYIGLRNRAVIFMRQPE